MEDQWTTKLWSEANETMKSFTWYFDSKRYYIYIVNKANGFEMKEVVQ